MVTPYNLEKKNNTEGKGLKMGVEIGNRGNREEGGIRLTSKGEVEIVNSGVTFPMREGKNTREGCLSGKCVPIPGKGGGG